MMCYKDRTYCSSAYCTDKCGRRLTEEDRLEANKLGLPICVADFCTKPDKEGEEND